jgi:myo-inositol-1(or 4)-monophosphatase
MLVDGQFIPLRAAIVQPATGDLYSAGRGLGAWCNGQRLALSTDTTDPRRWSIATGFSSNKGESLAGVIRCVEIMQNEILGMRINGAAALDLALTSRGIFDGFFESRLSPWDMAAGELLIREAGGEVVNYEGESFNSLSDKNIVAGPQHVVAYLLSMLRGVKEGLTSSAWP